MTRVHKQLLSQHRDSLVENMYPDDVLNRLQAKKILSTRDVTRIKEKGGIDSQNETLLDVLLRKPDRAFDELVASLRETDQDHVANIIAPRQFLICVNHSTVWYVCSELVISIMSNSNWRSFTKYLMCVCVDVCVLQVILHRAGQPQALPIRPVLG